MNWSEPSPPGTNGSRYDNCFLETPVGVIQIEWKSWKDYPSYDIDIEGKWIGVEYSLEEAKKLAMGYIISLNKELTEFLNNSK